MASARMSRLYGQASVKFSTHCSTVASRVTAQHACNAHLTLDVAAASAMDLDQRPRSNQVATRRSQPTRRRHSFTRTLVSPAQQLTLAIDACTSTAQLLELYRRRGPEFGQIHASAALLQLVRVAPGRTIVSSASSAEPPPVSEHYETSQAALQQTGRLQIRQGQETAQPPLQQDDHQQQQQERWNSNYEASTSVSVPEAASSSGQQGRQRQKQLRGRRSQNSGGGGDGSASGSAEAADGGGSANGSANVAGGGGSATGSVLAAADSGGGSGKGVTPAVGKAPHEAAPGKKQIVSMASGLASILWRSCPFMDGHDVAAAVSALSLLRYQKVPLLERLEQRAVELLTPAEAAGVRVFWTGKRAPAPAANAPSTKAHPMGKVAQPKVQPAATEAAGAGATEQPKHRRKRPTQNTKRQQQEAPISDKQPAAQQQQQQQQVGAAKVRHLAYLGMTVGELLGMVSGFGALGYRPSDAWLEAVVCFTEPRLAAFARVPSTLPSLLSGLANTGHRPPPSWLQAACAAAAPQLHSMSASQLRSLVAGLSAMQHLPDDGWIAEYLTASEAQLPNYTPKDLVNSISSLTALGCRPRESWIERFYERATGLLGVAGGLNGTQAGSIFASLSKLNCRPSVEWLNAVLVGTRRSLPDASAQELTDFVISLSSLRFRPPEPWLQQFFSASFQRLPFFTPQQYCSAAVAIARLGRPPRLWLEEFGRHLGGKLALMPGGQQSEAVAALVELNYKPSPAWLASYEQHSNARLAAYSAEELCRALKALTQMGFRPQVSWLYSFIMAAYSKLDAFDAAQLAVVFECLPALTPHGSWLDEIIQICAAEDAMRSQASAAHAQAEPGEPYGKRPLAVGAGGAGASSLVRPGSEGDAAEERELLGGLVGAAASMTASSSNAVYSSISIAGGGNGAHAGLATPGPSLPKPQPQFQPQLAAASSAQQTQQALVSNGTIAISTAPSQSRMVPGELGVLSFGAPLGLHAGSTLPLPLLDGTGGMAFSGGFNGAPELKIADVPGLNGFGANGFSVSKTAANSSDGGEGYRGGRKRSATSRGRSDSSGGGGGGGDGSDRGAGGGGNGGEVVMDGSDDGARPVVVMRPGPPRVPVAAVLAAAVESSAAVAPLAMGAGASGATTATALMDDDVLGPSVAAAPSLAPALQVVLQPKPRKPARQPVLPFTGSPQSQTQPVAAAGSASPGGAALLPALASAASAAPVHDDDHMQCLDAASLSRLIGPPDDPPGPDFSGCQERAAAARARKRRGIGAFQLGRVWTNDLAGGGNVPMPSPSPSG